MSTKTPEKVIEKITSYSYTSKNGDVYGIKINSSLFKTKLDFIRKNFLGYSKLPAHLILEDMFDSFIRKNLGGNLNLIKFLEKNKIFEEYVKKYND